MATIQDYLKQIETAVYGKDVRSAIYNALYQCYKDGKAGVLDLDARTRIAEIEADIQEMLESGTTSEAVQAKVQSVIDMLIADGSLANMTIADGSITNEKFAPKSVTTEKIDDRTVTYEKMSLISDPKQNTIIVNDVKHVNISSIYELIENLDTFYIKVVSETYNQYASMVIRACVQVSFSTVFYDNFIPKKITSFTNKDAGYAEYLYEISVSEFKQWVDDATLKFETDYPDYIQTLSYRFEKIGNDAHPVIIGKIEDYGADYIVYEETLEGIVNNEFASLVKKVVGESDDDIDSSLSTIEKIVKKHLEGKTIIFMGDSYTKGASSQFSALCQKYGATVDNRGIVSSSICGDMMGNKGFQPMWKRTEDVCKEYTDAGSTETVGAVVFMGGANDGFGISTFIGTGINDDDTGHIYGATNHLLKKFQSTFDCPVFVILQPVFPSNSTANQGVDDATAKLWGFDSADTMFSFGFTPFF